MHEMSQIWNVTRIPLQVSETLLDFELLHNVETTSVRVVQRRNPFFCNLTSYHAHCHFVLFVTYKWSSTAGSTGFVDSFLTAGRSHWLTLKLGEVADVCCDSAVVQFTPLVLVTDQLSVTQCSLMRVGRLSWTCQAFWLIIAGRSLQGRASEMTRRLWTTMDRCIIASRITQSCKTFPPTNHNFLKTNPVPKLNKLFFFFSYLRTLLLSIFLCLFFHGCTELNTS